MRSSVVALVNTIFAYLLFPAGRVHGSLSGLDVHYRTSNQTLARSFLIWTVRSPVLRSLRVADWVQKMRPKRENDDKTERTLIKFCQVERTF